MNIKTIRIMGCGLIGGSIYKKLQDLYGHEMQFERIEKDKRSEGYMYLKGQVRLMKTPDLTILAMPDPVEFIENRPSNFFDGHKLVIDVHSTKDMLVRKFEERFPNVNFVPCHPIAGSEKSGFENADKDLFKDCPVYIDCTRLGVDLVKGFWELMGGYYEYIGGYNVIKDIRWSGGHDEEMAYASHFPQWVVFDQGFKDHRLYNSNRAMWEKIFYQNSELHDLIRRFKYLAPEPYLVKDAYYEVLDGYTPSFPCKAFWEVKEYIDNICY